MKSLDLHGVMHEDVERLVENFLLLNETPLEIITGNSLVMKEIVLKLIEKYKFRYHYKNYINLGSIVIF